MKIEETQGVLFCTQEEHDLLKLLVCQDLQVIGDYLKHHAPPPPANESDPVAYWKSNRLVSHRSDKFQAAVEQYKKLKTILFKLEVWVSPDRLKKVKEERNPQ